MREFAAPHLCERCNDARWMTRYPSARQSDLLKCDRCGLMSDDEYRDWRRKRWGEVQKPPDICELDLTPEELTVYHGWRLEHPEASKMTVLSWIEGRRYDPSKDAEFLKEARTAFKEWRNR